jgi:RNA recognition motif-containing protein
MKIYVGQLSYDATAEDLRWLFAAFGQVTAVSLAYDKLCGHKGFGFVEMPEATEALAAINYLNGYALKGRAITLRPLPSVAEHPQRNTGRGPPRSPLRRG